MSEALWGDVESLLGLESEVSELGAGQMALRTLLVYVATLLPTLLAGGVLLGVHWLFAVLAFHTSWFGSIVKGNQVLLIRDGKVQHEGLRRASITSADLTEALRLETRQTDPAKVQVAYLERNGKISVVPFPREPRVLEVSVRAGVQTVRVEL